MPRRLASAPIAALVLIALWTSGASNLAHGVEIPLPNVKMVFSQSITPRRLSGTEAMPIALNLSGRIGTVDGSHPPALTQIVIDLDRHIAIDLRGLPVCRRDQRDFRPPDLTRCKDAIVGRGKVSFQIQFPEQQPISSESRLIVFNGGGGHKGGKATLYAAAFLTQPITSVFMMKIAIAKRRGGSRAIIEVPTLANGAGSLTGLSVKLKKRFARNGRVVGFLTGSCPTGTLQSRFSALFADGTALQGGTLQKCVPRSD